jgi:ribulose-5-phosphate 4-epimerase/fuculose-1-phosphate aldolase
MRFTVNRNGEDALRDRLAGRIVEAFRARGHAEVGAADAPAFVLNLTALDAPRPARRRNPSSFVVSMVSGGAGDTDLRARCYTALVRSLSNLLICVTPAGAAPVAPAACFTTPEAGFSRIAFDADAVYHRMLAVVGSHLAIGNRIDPDLPRRLWTPSAVVRRMQRAGRALDGLGLLPAPFPLERILGEAERRQVFRLYGLTGLSYGNLSAREAVPELGPVTFWMTARGVDKSRLEAVGRDVLLVKGFDAAGGTALVSAPPGFDPRARVSVDAVEHERIYRGFPAVGAVVHVHAWMDGVPCTRQVHPCGSRELADEVADLLRRCPDPARAVVGLVNHGLTITGPDLDEIFRRIRGRLRTQVPMAG